MVQNKPIKGVLVDVNNPRPQVVTITDCLQEYYRILDCDTIECTSRKIGGVWYDLIVDEEGALTDSPIVSAIGETKRVLIYGNIFIVRGNEETGEWESLTDEDIENILGKHAMFYVDSDNERLRPIIVLDGEYGTGVGE